METVNIKHNGQEYVAKHKKNERPLVGKQVKLIVDEHEYKATLQ